MSRRRPARLAAPCPDTGTGTGTGDVLTADAFTADAFTVDGLTADAVTAGAPCAGSVTAGAFIAGSPVTDASGRVGREHHTASGGVQAAVADPLTCLVDPGAAGSPGPAAWLASLLAGAVEATAGVDLGSVAETSAEGTRTWAATLPVAEELDRCGAEWDEGPGAEALREHTPAGTVRITSLHGAGARRWPRWTARARAAGVAATLSVVLPGGPRKRPAVLALHGPDPSSLGAASVSAARAFAAPLAVALHAAARIEGLTQALESRDVIGQAKGVLMAYHGVDDRTAFDQLVVISQRNNVRLVEIAKRVAADHPRPSRPD